MPAGLQADTAKWRGGEGAPIGTDMEGGSGKKEGFEPPRPPRSTKIAVWVTGLGAFLVVLVVKISCPAGMSAGLHQDNIPNGGFFLIHPIALAPLATIAMMIGLIVFC